MTPFHASNCSRQLPFAIRHSPLDTAGTKLYVLAETAFVVVLLTTVCIATILEQALPGRKEGLWQARLNVLNSSVYEVLLFVHAQ